MTAADAVPLAALAVTVLTALRWPRPGAELVTGTLAAGSTLAVGAVSVDEADTVLRDMTPVVGLLVALLVLGAGCSAAGLFDAVGRMMSSATPSRPRLALPYATAAAAATTVALSLDATVVLLTPALAIAARRIGHPSRPYELISARIANSASLLLPVSNLTNLLALGASGLGFVEWAWLMLPVWLCAVAVEYAVVRLACPPVPSTPTARPAATPDGPHDRNAGAAAAVVALVLVGFGVGSYAGVEPVWVATTGALVLAWTTLSRGQLDLRTLVRSGGLPFAYFVLCWGVVVAGVANTSVARELAAHLPAGSGLLSLVGLALVSMVFANLLNNLPATLLLVPLTATSGPVALLAVLVGVNVGSNLTYAGSLANLLWRKVLLGSPGDDPARVFHRLGVLTTPPAVVLCTCVLWGWTSLVR